jgi:hypothetical protein
MPFSFSYYPREQLERFLRAVDAALKEPIGTVVIGGAAAILHYGVPRATRDIDTFTALSNELQDAFNVARRVTGIDIPVQQSGVADAPYEYESRLERAYPQFERLMLWIPERHDFALIKVLRGDERDINDLADLHIRSPLNCDILVDRYDNEMDHVMGDPGRLLGNFLNLIARLFPDQLQSVSQRLQARLRERKNRLEQSAPESLRSKSGRDEPDGGRGR